MRGAIVFGREVRRALDQGQPVVALDSTLVAHELPRPDNFDTACEFESIVREEGACPATVAIVDGQIRVGLDVFELAGIAGSGGARPLGPRQLAHATSSARPLTGATTVATTALLAVRAGIRVFAPSAVGDVPREWTDDDRSWDLTHERVSVIRVDGSGDAAAEWCVAGPAGIAGLLREQHSRANGSVLLVTSPMAGADLALHRLATELVTAERVEGRVLTPYLVGGAVAAPGLAAVRGSIRFAAQIAVAWARTSWWP